MATQVLNQASLTYNYGNSSGEALSNIAYTTLQGPVDASKHSLEASYEGNGIITYTLFIKNSSASAYTGVTVSDNLGTYELANLTEVTPLTYVGPTKLYINNIYTSTLTPVDPLVTDHVAFNVGSLPANSTAMLQYKVKTNQYAPLTPEISTITNTAIIDATELPAEISASNEIPVNSYASLVIEKSMAPNPVTGGGTIAYTFVIKNYGNAEATDVVLKDEFTTPITTPSLTVDGVSETGFDFENQTLLFPGLLSTYEFKIPAANITQNPTTGVVSIDPGEKTVVVTGTI